ncbi:hypothetical protein F0562_015835 [Nyssa sinensis]|uniref:Phorbol-ester/DAG-type domain-containing protein n=1 Tax=Nyssa sinensis TaxID=561372 RepID=A0A5J4ZL81_9ASTE|nr:hypothetical protein F0562_015835 [Nyssa sinensis]
MGKLDADPIIHHFSHQHPFKLLNLQPQTTKTTCAGCKREAYGWIYSCSTCNYYLHKACFKMPQTLSHVADTKHALTLLSSPAYPEGAFKCNACGGIGTGFCYHCKECELDIHTICAFMPSSIKHNAHDHPLDLCFDPPYDNKGFMCDVCKGTGSNHWLYRCDSCEFDAHMKCAKANTKSQPTTSSIQQNHQPQLFKSRSVPTPIEKPLNNLSSWSQTNHHFSPLPTIQQQPIGIPYIHTQYPILENEFSKGPPPYFQPIFGVPQNPQPSRTNTIVNDVLGHVIEGIMDGIAQQAGQALLDGV